MTSPLPQELIDAIIDTVSDCLLPELALRTLTSCVLVSKAFSFRSRKKLFRSVKIDGAKHLDIIPYAKALQSIMAPECYFPMGGIAQYIEKFTIKFDNKQMSETDYRLILTNVLKILNDESSGSVEPMELTIDGVHKSPKPYCEWPSNYRSTMCWRHLSPGFQSAFAALCRSPRLKKLNIIGVSRLPTSITLFDGTSIKDLHMSFCSSFEPRSLVGPRLRPAVLEYFETDSTFAEEDIDPIYTETLLLSNVKEMRFPYTFFGVGSTVRHGIETLISLSGRNLKRLYLAHRPVSQPSIEPRVQLDFRLCPNIEFLEIHNIQMSDTYCSFPHMPVPAAFVKHLIVRTHTPHIGNLEELLKNGTFPSLARLDLDLVIGPHEMLGAESSLSDLDLEKQFEEIKRHWLEYSLPSLCHPTLMELNVNIADHRDLPMSFNFLSVYEYATRFADSTLGMCPNSPITKHSWSVQSHPKMASNKYHKYCKVAEKDKFLSDLQARSKANPSESLTLIIGVLAIATQSKQK